MFFLFLFAITAAGVVPCGGPKKFPHISSIVQIIFPFWSFAIREGILRKLRNISRIFLILFLLFAQDICRLWVHVLTSTHNQCFGAKIRKRRCTSAYPSFTM